ncbi:MAG: hypothetical protein ACRD5H_08285 [Nitrososphaerales archaeon]
MNHQELQPLIDECRYEIDVDSQIALLYAINEQLTASVKLDLPSFMTNDYVQRALDLIEVRLSETEDSGSPVSSTDGSYLPSCQMLHD